MGDPGNNNTPAKRGRPPSGISRQERDRQRAATRRANRGAACLNIMIPAKLMAGLKTISKRAGRPVWRLALEALEKFWIEDYASRGRSSEQAKNDAAKWREEFESGLKVARKAAVTKKRSLRRSKIIEPPDHPNLLNYPMLLPTLTSTGEPSATM